MNTFLSFIFVIINSMLALVSPNPVTISMLVVVLVCFAATVKIEFFS